MATLSRSDVEHVAGLARLGLDEAEITRLEGQLNDILERFEVLAQLDTDAIAPTAQVIALEGVMRDDVVRPSLSVEEALANAPERREDFFTVPKVVE